MDSVVFPVKITTSAPQQQQQHQQQQQQQQHQLALQPAAGLLHRASNVASASAPSKSDKRTLPSYLCEPTKRKSTVFFFFFPFFSFFF
jgi:transcription initiation factor TFIID subunit TAF12